MDVRYVRRNLDNEVQGVSVDDTLGDVEEFGVQPWKEEFSIEVKRFPIFYFRRDGYLRGHYRT